MQPIVDTSLWLAHKRRALANPAADADFLMRRAAEELADRLGAVERKFDRAAVLFCQTPAAVDVLATSGKVADIVRVEADAAFLGDGAGGDGAGGDAAGLVAPLETVPFEPESLDLAVSLLSLQAMNDIPGMLVQVRRALKPDGLFLGAFAGAGTLSELRECLLAAETEFYGGASPRVIPFTDVRDAGALLQRAGLALPVADVETVTVRYDSLFGLMADLRAMGETSALIDRSRRPATRKLFARAAEIYAERFSDADGRVRASFPIVWMSGWAPDASQQKPLKPGSAKLSLKTILENPGRR
ncbi:methyltransferase domain-containing protein [Mesorhizobium muleiense]|uniref:methyltransferase domain-containing protein n=1 Tax=Mesorhizobium muleiense TaxID=1004279 RepID=UPI003AFB2996